MWKPWQTPIVLVCAWTLWSATIAGPGGLARGEEPGWQWRDAGAYETRAECWAVVRRNLRFWPRSVLKDNVVRAEDGHGVTVRFPEVLGVTGYWQACEPLGQPHPQR